jgi:hypothetical protein
MPVRARASIEAFQNAIGSQVDPGLEPVEQQTCSGEALLVKLKKAGFVWLEGEYTISN